MKQESYDFLGKIYSFYDTGSYDHRVCAMLVKIIMDLDCSEEKFRNVILPTMFDSMAPWVPRLKTMSDYLSVYACLKDKENFTPKIWEEEKDFHAACRKLLHQYFFEVVLASQTAYKVNVTMQEIERLTNEYKDLF